jgi:hypothetical protein
MKLSQPTSKSLTTLAVCLLATTVTTRAQTVTNTFTNPNFDLVNNGIIGSGFDGVDLNSGDIPHGSGAGKTLTANSGAVLGDPGSGFLFVENPVGGFAGAEDDGFFSFNIVWGDFDAYVDVTAPFDVGAYTFAGLLARAISDGTGEPYNPTGTNASENWLNITRFEEFGIPTQVRYASNAADNQITVTNLYGPVDSTTSDVFLRINRTGDVFSFYDSASYGGPWTLERTITRTDLHGAAMQVGIEEGSFGGGSTPTITFADYGVMGTNIVKPPVNDPVNLLVSNPNTNGSVQLSWTPAAGSGGSIVVLTENLPITQSPYYGFAYTNANALVGSVVNMGGNQQVVYAGSGTNVTVSGLFGSNDVYNVAVYSYTTNGGTTPITYDSNPATNSFNGPGVIVGITASLSLSSIPVNGVATVSVLANFSSGGTLNVSGSASATSSDPAINATAETVNGVGVIVLGASAVTAGNTNGNVTVTYAGFSNNINVISHVPVFTDNFSTPHSYLTNGVEGTGWNGVYETNTDIAGAVGPTLAMSLFDADITSNNCLTISSANGEWKNNDDKGPFLYMIVPGDFETSVHITGYNHVGYNFVGLLARGFSTANNASPFGTGGTEDNVNWQRFDQFGDSTVLFNTVNGVTAESDDQDGDSADYWLLMTRVNATNFFLFKSATFGGPWTLVHQVVQPAFVSGTMLQVGLQQATYSGAVGIVQFDTFMLDGDGIVGSLLTPATVPTPATNVQATLTAGDTAAIITWTNGVIPPSGAPTAFVVMRAGSPVSSQPYFGDLTTANSIFGAGTDLGGGNFLVYRGGGTTVTVTGLTPGVQYYVEVYEYAGSSTTKAFNDAGGAAAATPPVVFTGITAVVSSPAVPVNGIGGSYQILASVEGVTNLIDVSGSATLIATNGIVTGANGVFTGLSVGTDTNVKFSFTAGGTTFTTPAYSVSARAPSYSDNFGKPINYLALAQAGSNAVANTIWDGVFLGGASGAPAGYSVPGGFDGGGQTTTLDASITESNALTLVHQNDTWDGGGAGGGPDDGFFIYKNVAGDFQVSVFVTNMQQVAYQMSGIMARLATYNGAAASGISGVENFINQTEFEEFGFLDILRFDINSVDDNFGTPPPVIPANNGFLMVRTHGTNFTFYRRSSPTNAFVGPIATYTENLPLFASGTSNVVEVGISSATYNLPASGLESTTFTRFMLDLTTGPVLSYSVAGGNLTITWDASDSFQHLYATTNLLSPFTLLASATVTTANGISSVTVPIGTGNEYYKVGP